VEDIGLAVVTFGVRVADLCKRRQDINVLPRHFAKQPVLRRHRRAKSPSNILCGSVFVQRTKNINTATYVQQKYLHDVCLSGGPAGGAVRAGAIVRRHLALPAARQPLLHVGQQAREHGQQPLLPAKDMQRTSCRGFEAWQPLCWGSLTAVEAL